MQFLVLETPCFVQSIFSQNSSKGSDAMRVYVTPSSGAPLQNPILTFAGRHFFQKYMGNQIEVLKNEPHFLLVILE